MQSSWACLSTCQPFRGLSLLVAQHATVRRGRSGSSLAAALSGELRRGLTFLATTATASWVQRGNSSLSGVHSNTCLSSRLTAAGPPVASPAGVGECQRGLAAAALPSTAATAPGPQRRRSFRRRQKWRQRHMGWSWPDHWAAIASFTRTRASWPPQRTKQWGQPHLHGMLGAAKAKTRGVVASSSGKGGAKTTAAAP